MGRQGQLSFATTDRDRGFNSVILRCVCARLSKTADSGTSRCVAQDQLEDVTMVSRQHVRCQKTRVISARDWSSVPQFELHVGRDGVESPGVPRRMTGHVVQHMASSRPLQRPGSGRLYKVVKTRDPDGKSDTRLIAG